MIHCVMLENRTFAELIQKYDRPTPRYTSYPTVPFWNSSAFSPEVWTSSVKRVFDETNDTQGISIYIHLPFCESLCTYCACNKRITRNHNVEIGYIRSLLKEWNTYLAIFGRKPLIRDLHLGGGTPTFFSPANLKWLVSWLLEEGVVHPQARFSFEGHPNNTTREHLQTLFDLGFRRVSFGVQDLDEKVQKTINRIQPFENLERVTRESREIGYQSVSFDIIYGLPFQTPDSVAATINRILGLKPDRISFYSYAHVPWVSPGQRGYDERDLPTDVEKRGLYELGKRVLTENDYEEIGMDHFALRSDTLFQALENGELHRNFMGYTEAKTDLLIGLGASAISDARYAYAQNEKRVETYSESVRTQGLAIVKGHSMTDDDVFVRKAIIDVACRGVIPSKVLERFRHSDVQEAIGGFCSEGILEEAPDGFAVTELGRTFIRNVCSVFDRHLKQHATAGTPIFSRAI